MRREGRLGFIAHDQSDDGAGEVAHESGGLLDLLLRERHAVGLVGVHGVVVASSILASGILDHIYIGDGLRRGVVEGLGHGDGGVSELDMWYVILARRGEMELAG